MPSVCSNASWKTWTPLADRFIDEHRVEMLPFFDQLCRPSDNHMAYSTVGCYSTVSFDLQLINVMNPAAIHPFLQLPLNLACWEILR